MTTLGTRLIGEVWDTFKAHGALSSATLSHITQGTITSTSIITGTPSAGSTTSTTIQVLMRDFREREIDGTQVVRGDRTARFPSASVSFTPDADDQMTVGSRTYRVVNVQTPADGASYELQLRGI